MPKRSRKGVVNSPCRVVAPTRVKGGKSIRQIGQMAREELAELLERPVHLFTFVKVREKWLDDPARYREMGLDFPI